MRSAVRQLSAAVAGALILVLDAPTTHALSDVESQFQQNIAKSASDIALRKCHQALAKNVSKFADGKFRLTQKCLENFNKGKLSSFSLPRECATADVKTREKITSLKARAQAGVLKKCADDCFVKTIGEDISTESGSENCGSGTNPDITSGLVGYWPMDEPCIPERATKDLVGGKDGRFEHGTPELVPGKISGALRFSESVYLNCGLSDRFDITQTITFAAWLKKDKDGRKSRIASRLGYYDDANAGWLACYGRNDNNIEWGISRDGVDWTHGFTSKGSIPYDQWRHIAVTYDGNVLRAYINGQEDISGDFPLSVGGPIHLSQAELLIGQDRAHGQAIGGPKTWSWTGLMDDVRLYNRALTAVDVAALYAWDGDAAIIPQAH